MKDNYDVIIVGAGPAGCSAANFIAKQGWSVLLVDKAEFPRDKICGDGISAKSISVLERMGVLNEILTLNPQKIDNIIVSAPNGRVMIGKNTVVQGLSDHGYVIPRKEFDHKLFEFVRQVPGVDVRQGFPVKDLMVDKSAVCGIIGAAEQVRGRIIIGADGVTIAHKEKQKLFNSSWRFILTRWTWRYGNFLCWVKNARYGSRRNIGVNRLFSCLDIDLFLF
jgi:2-polyprenyl-6-methoxyphenol hydroxylase-like FAD-dependent oxidoreductase